MKFEKGKSYRNGHNKKCRLIEILKNGNLVWVKEEGGYETVLVTNKNGKIWDNENSYDDIIGEWKEPKKMIAIMYLDLNTGTHFVSAWPPEVFENVAVVAKKEIVEGDGLVKK
jgi:hypothetical protein